MVAVRVPPGRAGRLWLRRRLAVARRGSDLLERKLRILLVDRERLRERERVTSEAWRQSVAEAETWLLRASLIGGERAVRLATVPGFASVTVAWTSAMGVRHPQDATCEVPLLTSFDAAPGGAALARAQREYARAIEAAAHHAAAHRAVELVSAEITTTRQRVRALQRRWIPTLEQALVHIELELEEHELAEGVRRLRALSTQDAGDPRAGAGVTSRSRPVTPDT